MNLCHSTSTLPPKKPPATFQEPAVPLHRVCPEFPYQAGWLAYGGHRMYVGALPSGRGDTILGVTDKIHEAAGFKTAQECEAAMRAAGFLVGGHSHLEIAPFTGQMALF